MLVLNFAADLLSYAIGNYEIHPEDGRNPSRCWSIRYEIEFFLGSTDTYGHR